MFFYRTTLSRIACITCFSLIAACAKAQHFERPVFELSAGPVISSEYFRWSIAGDMQGENPNILSELTYKDQKKAGLELRSTYRLMPRFFVSGSYQYLSKYAGNATDIDYTLDNREDPDPQPGIYSKKGKENHLELNAGYILMEQQLFQLNVTAGYYRNKTGYLIHGEDKDFDKALYYARWQGPRIGINSNSLFNNTFGSRFSLAGNYISYKATADWILRTEFQHPLSFEHKGGGWGFDGYAGIYLQATRLLRAELGGSWRYWKTGHGTDLLYRVDADDVSTRMNESVRRQFGAVLKCTVLF